MSPWFLSVFARMLSWLPLWANQVLGATVGRLIWAVNASPRRITEINLKLCFPDMPIVERRELAFQSIIETGKQLTECAWIWHRPQAQIENKIIDIVDEELLDEASKTGKGVIVISPHIGNWELCSLPLSRKAPFTYFYRSPRKAGMDKLLIKWRAHLDGQPASLDAAGIRQSFGVLKRGEILGVLPDQEPDPNNGVFAPFFSEPALTMTLLSKLAKRSGATLLFCVAERLPKGEGWRFHIIPADDAIAGSEINQSTAAINRGVEQCIERCPAQYLWDYKRFTTLPDGTRRSYR